MVISINKEDNTVFISMGFGNEGTKELSICFLRSVVRLVGKTKAYHSFFQTVPSDDCMLLGHTRYAVMMVINLSLA